MDLGASLKSGIEEPVLTFRAAKDSTAFDAKSYYEQLITTSSLPALLKRENDLLTGV
jgi:hypothetical protein